MNFLISADSDVGTTKETNQDSLSVRLYNTEAGRMVFAVLCDGMGGLSCGELASSTVVKAFLDWSETELPLLAAHGIQDHILRDQWGKIIEVESRRIMDYGQRQRLNLGLGTTALVLLVTESRYYLLNVGDGRAYEIAETVQQLTVDQTVVAREVALGNMTEDEARVDSQRNVLLQCVGASEVVAPDFFFGDTSPNAVYMLCSDGFRHEITLTEIWEYLNPYVLTSADAMGGSARHLIDLNKERLERDNISVVLIRTY